MVRINLNKMAKRITLAEGGKKSVNIAQVKEVMKLLFQNLAKERFEDVIKVLLRYRK